MEHLNDTEIMQKAIEVGVDVEWAIACRQRFLKSIELFNKKAKDAQKWAHRYYKQFLIKDLSCLKESRDNAIKKLPSGDEFERHFAFEDLKELNPEIERLEKRLRYYDRNRNDNKFRITDDMIQRAKEQPIEELLPHPVKNKKTNCFHHDDKNPSMGVKNNKVHCFVCNKTWDSIAVICELRGLRFPDAVRALAC